MNRRNFLRGGIPTDKTVDVALAPPTAGFEPYTGTWSRTQAAHLLKRAVFGPTFENIILATNEGLNSTVDRLFNIQKEASLPLNYNFDADPKVPIGSSWVDKSIYANQNSAYAYRRQSLFAWTINVMIADNTIREKMTLFWHTHFVTSDIQDPTYTFKYLAKLRDNCLGNFKTLTQMMTIDPAMLRYLNGNQNVKAAPNENYARELLELFTIGKGPLAGPGDYTNYTESDIAAIAKILTGWRDVGYLNPNIDVISSVFIPANHDTTSKTLSNRFGSAKIDNAGENEYKVLIDIIFKQEDVSKFLARKLYRYFIAYDIDSSVETNVITPMAKMIRDDKFEVSGALKTLLKSAHFYEKIGCMIKNPFDIIVGAVSQSKTNLESTTISLADKYNTGIALHGMGDLLQMQYHDAPNVAGWKAYYQNPLYFKIWINSVTLPHRINIVNSLLTSTNVTYRNVKYTNDIMGLVGSLSNPLDINAVVNDLGTLFFAKNLSTSQKAALKAQALLTVADPVWTTEYNTYKANPNNATNKAAVENRIKRLLTYMATMPEFQMM
jgi:uncharacterized protein (DUF1800 family)